MPPSRPLNQLGQLQDVHLSKVDFERNVYYDPSSDVLLSYVVETAVQASVSEGHDLGVATLETSIVWSRTDDIEKELDLAVETPFALKVSVRGIFGWMAPDMEEEEITSWLEFNAEHLMWPYLRSYIQMVTGWSDIPQLTIYTIGIPRPHLGRDHIGQDNTFG